MSALYVDLQWLPTPAPDWSKRLSAAAADGAPIGGEVRALANHALDLNQLTRLARAIGRLHLAGADLTPLVPFKLAVLGNGTLDLLAPALIASAVRHGIHLEIIRPEYAQVAQEALTTGSVVNASRPDAVLLALDHRALPLTPAIGDEEAAQAGVQATAAFLRSLGDGIKTHAGATCIFQTFAPPSELLFGSLDRAVPGTLRNSLDAINRDLAAACLARGDVLLDIAALAETVGLAAWHDTQVWNLAKMPFSNALIPLYADHIGRTVAALRGKSRRVLILDLDNTVWGGVIGDDGLEGIRIAEGDPVGEAHRSVQRAALDLRSRGVVLAVSSKNTDEIARSPFRNHPEMLLRLDHLAVFQANWNDKASNIKAIASELSLGLDAMVFLDDNPVERALVRSLLPEVAVPELPEQPDYYARTLAAAGYFEAITFSTEDAQRADFYQNNARRLELEEQVGGVDAYLASLDMTITFEPFDAIGRARIAQLINKSNQYNLTTRRYTESDVAAAERDPDAFTLQVRLSDIFGDNGMISVIICRVAQEGAWAIDTWLMSCRVLGRKVEHMVLSEIVRAAQQADIRRLIGHYVPTDRNGLVRDHYSKLGFACTGEEENGSTRWELELDQYAPDAAPMRVERRGCEDGSTGRDGDPVTS